MGRKHVHQTAQFGKLEIIASCMIFQIDPIRQFCTKHVPMTQYAIIISTSTTPSCGGPLRAQIFRKVCFYEQKYDFWPIRTRFDPFKGTPKFIFFNTFFSNIRFLSFIVTLSPLAKNAVPMVKSVNFDSLGPLLPFSKAHPPKVMKNGNFQK